MLLAPVARPVEPTGLHQSPKLLTVGLYRGMCHRLTGLRCSQSDPCDCARARRDISTGCGG